MKKYNKTDSIYSGNNDNSIDIREVLEKYLSYYKWFLLSFVLAMLCATIYLRCTPKQYEVSSTILIDDQKNGGSSSEIYPFEDLGLLRGQTSIDNEIGILKSRRLMKRVVKDLKLNVSYSTSGKFREEELFANTIPFKINFFVEDSVFDRLSTSFSLKRISNTSFILKNKNEEQGVTHNFGESIRTVFGSFTVTPRNENSKYLKNEITVLVRPVESVAVGYRSRIKIEPKDEKSSLINLTLREGVKEKGIKILDYLVIQYNNDAIADKSSIGKNTDIFINERLAVITKNLTLIDKGVEDFKTVNKLTNIEAESGLILNTNNIIEQNIVELNTQLKLVDYVAAYVNSNTNELIPANLGLADESTNQNTLQYNELLLEYNRILNSSGKLNPVLLNLEAQILQLRESIKQGLVNLRSSLSISLNDAKRQEKRLNTKITSVPKKEREFRDIQRQQQIIETLYLYLLEKREENAISLAVTAPNAKIIDKAYGSSVPVLPLPRKVYFMALLIGLAIPFGILFLISIFDNKVHTIEDLEKEIDLTILGDVPNFKTKRGFVITNNDIGPVTEAFRMLQTNISFLLSKIKAKHKTLFVTSTVSGEGKSVVSINLASIFALSGKKVLLIGGDIRSPKLAKYLSIPKKEGLSHYLMDKNIHASELIEPADELGFDLLQSGTMPPNISQLFMNGRFEELMAYGRENYDFVIVDTAPVSLVTDTILLAENNADLVVYVIRANYLDKRMLQFPQKLYRNKQLENMAVLLNDTKPLSDRGYGYEYGYGYNELEEKKSWWSRIFKRS